MKNFTILLLIVLLLAGCNMPAASEDEDVQNNPPEDTAVPNTEVPDTDTPEPALPDPTATYTTEPEEPAEVPTEEPVEPQPPEPVKSTPTLSDNVLPGLESGTPLIISEISMISNTTGWAVGGVEDGDIHILRTTDGAESFRDVTPPLENTGESLKVSAYFLDENNAWAIYSNGFGSIPDPVIVWRTMDGGETWLPSEPLAKPNPEFYLPDDFVFANQTTGWLLVHVGAGMMKDYIFLYNTHNGGESWEIVFDPYNAYGPHSCSKTGMDFTSDGYGVLTIDCMGVRDGAIINTTTNSGVEWTEHILSAPESAPAVFDVGNVCKTESPQILPSGKIVVAVSCEAYLTDHYETTGSFQYSLEVGADIWESTEYPGGDLLYVDENTAFAFSEEIYISNDGGQTWVKQKEVNWEAEASFVSGAAGWAVVRADGEIALVYTTDSGLIWNTIEPILVP